MSCHRHSTIGLQTLHINTTRPRPELSEFECAPRAAIEFMSLEATSASGKTDTESAYQIGQSSNNGTHNNNKLNRSAILPSDGSPQMAELDTTGDDRGQLHDDFVDANDVDDEDKVGIKRTNSNRQRTLRALKLEPAYYMSIEPLELTCAFYINDELDLNLTQVEWWQLNENKALLEEHSRDSNNKKSNPTPQNILLWRFNGTQRWLRQARLKDEANGGGEEHAIIDYVTRANGSRLMSSSYDDSPFGGGQTTRTPERNGQQESDSESKVGEKEEPIELAAAESRVATQAQAEEFRRKILYSSPALPSSFSSIKKPSGGDGVAATSEQLARVIHLIVNPPFDSEHQQTSSSGDRVRREYLCRITNKIGRLDIVYTIHIDSDSNVAHFEAEKRQFLRRKLIDDESTINSNWPKSLFNNNKALDLSSSSRVDPTRLVDRAKLLIIKELNNNKDNFNQVSEETPLFIPLHLPKDLLQNQLNNSSSNLEATREFSLARSFQNQSQNQNQDHQQRTATRQTNGTNILMANLLASQSQSPQTTNTVIHVGKGGDLTNSPEVFKNDSKWSFKRSINSIALDLISRYTSNKRSLIFGNINGRDLSSLDNNLLHSRGYFSSNYEPAKPSGDSLTNIIEILRANEKPFNVRLSFAMKLLIPEKILNFLIAWQQQILLVVLMFTCVTITVCLTSLCRRDKVADSNDISNSTIKKRRKHKVRSGWRGKKSKFQKAHISVIDIDHRQEDEEEEEEQQSPPSASSGNELDEYVQLSAKEAQIRPESGSAITTTNGSQVKLINSNTSSDESQLRFNSDIVSRKNGMILSIVNNIDNLNNGLSESQQQQQQQQLDESILNSISSQLNEQASNQFHRFISSGGDSLSPSDEMNTELENDASGNLEADNEDGTSQSRFKIGGYKSEKSHSSSLDPSEISCFKQINYGLSYTGNNINNNNNKFLADRYRLIMVSPQEELQELLVAPPHYCPDGDMMSHYHPQQKQLEITSTNPSMLLQHDSAYYLCNQNMIGQRQQYEQNELFWPIPDSCKDTTVGPSQQSFAGPDIRSQQELQGHQNYQEHRQQVQQQFFVAPPPKLRSIRENKDAFHVDIESGNFIRERQQQSFKVQPEGQINMTLPARKNLSRISPSFASSNNEQFTSSSSPAASTSSSLTPATGCFSRDQLSHAQQANQYSRQQSGRNQSARYLEDALQLLDSSVNDCLPSENRFRIER